MKIRAYIRIAKTARGYKVEARSKPTNALIDKHPTVSFAVDFEISDSSFKKAEQVIAEIKVPEESVKADINIPSKSEVVMDKLKGKQ